MPHLPLVDNTGRFKVEPLAILDMRLIPHDNKVVAQVLICWSNSLLEYTTWEDWVYIQAHFPQFNPWGQELIQVEGNAMSLSHNSSHGSMDNSITSTTILERHV